MEQMEFDLMTLAPVWTGGPECKCDKLHLTGIKGSIRWWMEVIVRGLDVYACNPGSKYSEDKCALKLDKNIKNLDEKLINICPVCQIFGCTGWSGKVILRIDEKKKEEKGKELFVPIPNLFNRGIPFTLRFIERKKLAPYEKKLLIATIKLIVEYGALGGKTVLKPSEKEFKNFNSYSKQNHLDYGIIEYQVPCNEKISVKEIPLNNPPGKKNEPNWPDLRNFWFIKEAYLNREQHNKLVSGDNFLKGCISESKKIFSFHGFPKSNGGKDGFSPRCFGYAMGATERDKIKKEVQAIFSGKTIETGEEVLDEL